jgi:hypothetical protein
MSEQWRQKLAPEYWRDQWGEWRDALGRSWQALRDIDWRDIDWRTELKPRKLRTTVNEHAKGVSLGLAIFILLISMVSLWSYMRRPALAQKAVRYAYFVDEETGRETYEPIRAVPPLTGASGKPTLVRAFFYSCDGGKTRIAAYYDEYLPEAKKLLEAHQEKGMDAATYEQVESGHVVRSPGNGAPWVPFSSVVGMQVRNSFHCADGGTVTFCTP